ncbi:MAG: ATP-dependent Clp protease proteolytic subunit [Ruminococcus sp.]|nr:ATP-dependent Clp protease proteolytic subunit [Ruminococcus sp.]
MKPEIINSNIAYVHKGSRGTSVIPLDSEFLTKRVVPIFGSITAEAAQDFYKSFMFLSGSKEPIIVPIFSNGGEVSAGRSMYDTMQLCGCEVHTVCVGIAASMAATLLAAGTKGHRSIIPHGEVMIHEVLVGGGIGGSATSISRISQSVNETRDLMNGILARHTGKSIEEINKATSFDNYMNAEQAVEFGICDNIVTDIFKEV